MIDRLILKTRELIHFLLHLNIYFGKKVILRGVPKILYGKKIIFGDNVRLNDNVYLHAVNGIEIGDNSTISYGAAVITESYDLTSEEAYIHRRHQGAPIKIGKNVWVCANATILPGVQIADDIVIAAGAVVNRNLDIQGGLYAGNPAKFIKKRTIK